MSPMFFACSLGRRRPRQKRGKCLEPTSRAAGPHVQEEANRVAIAPARTAVPFIAINVIKSCSARPHEEGSGGGAITPLRTLVSLVQSPQRFNLEPQSRNFNHATSKEVCAPLQPHLIHCIPAVSSHNRRKIRSTYVSRKCGGYKFCAFTMFPFSHEQKKTEAASQKVR